MIPSRTIPRIVFVTVCFLSTSALNCPLKSAVNQIVKALNDAIYNINIDSASWQNELNKLEQNGFVQLNSTISTQIDQLLKGGIATVSSSAQCDIDFIGNRTKEVLSTLVATLKHKKVTVFPEYICQASPAFVNLGLSPEQRINVDIFGYNFVVPGATVKILRSGNEVDPPKGTNPVSVPSPYQMSINISDTNGLQLASTDTQIILRINNGANEVTINVVAAPAPPTYSVLSDATLTKGEQSDNLGPTPFKWQCPANTVAVGLAGTAHDFIDSVALSCSTVNPDGTVGPDTGGASFGGKGAPQQYGGTCPNGGVLVGLSGAYGKWLNSLNGQCNTPESVVSQTGTITKLFSSDAGGGEAGPTPFAVGCPSNQVITGINGNYGSYINHLNFYCSTLQKK